MTFIKSGRDDILKPLQAVVGAIPQRSTLPILSNVLIHQSGETVTFTGTDMATQIRVSAEVGVPGVETSVSVSAKKLVDILRALPEDSVSIALTDSNGRLTVKSGKSRFTLQTLPHDQHPTLSISADQQCEVTMSGEELRAALKKVSVSMADGDVRTYLNGMQMSFTKTGFEAAASDGARLAVLKLSKAQCQGEGQAIVPRKAVQELGRLLEKFDSSVLLQVQGRHLHVTMGTVELWTRLVDGKFPEFERFIPRGHPIVCEVDRAQLAQTLSRVALLANERFRGVSLILDTDKLTVQSSNEIQEGATEELDIKFSGVSVDVSFNELFLVEGLAASKAETVRLELKDANSPALMTFPAEPGFKYVVMPTRR